MRRLLCLVLLCLCLAAPAAAASPEAPSPKNALRLEPGEQAAPGQAAWPLGTRQQNGARVDVSADPDTPGGFRVGITPAPGQKTAQSTALRTCLGLTSAVRLDLYKTRAVEFRIKASRPVAGILALTSSNTQNRNARDRAFGSFTIGTGWKTLRLPYGTLAPMPGWTEEARRLGLAPGDNVLRPDSIEDFCLGVEAGRLPEDSAQEPLVIQIDGPRFVR